MVLDSFDLDKVVLVLEFPVLEGTLNDVPETEMGQVYTVAVCM